MDATLSTTTQDSLLFLFPAAATLLSPLLAVLLVALSLLWLYPGGPAWALISSRSRATPPPPPGAPGVVTALAGPAAHRALASLSRSLPGGAALSVFSVGLTRLVVASQPDTARELLASAAFADRPVKDAARGLLFHRAMGFAPSGDYWRALRRISSAYLFSPRSVSATAPRRVAIGERMLRDLSAAAAGGGGEVVMRRVLHAASLDHVMATVFGARYDADSAEGAELEEMVKEGYDLLGLFNWGDHLPLLRWLDLQGVRRRCRSLVSRVNVFVARIIEEHRRKKKDDDANGESAAGDFVDVLLGLEGEEKLSDSDMIAVLWEMIFRGTDTVAILLEWVMARMVLHPGIQSKTQAELDAVVGRGRAVSDADVARLPYLQRVVKETLRVHPPGPLLSWARLAVHDAVVGGHLVPAGTTAMVNMWAIAHDPAVWADPSAFRPERFEEEDVSVLGGDLRLAPFGAGRRVCPGKTLALATVHLWLAQLLHRFQWAPADGGVDLAERLGMSLEMEKPLVCKPTPRW
ncbi:cytochrome P450 78A5-like [Miscanthus floridulus]|uniref:cytochrome P450 78A5-like n=1 Tax=Miscanthus floridulus TaxID=154761 RepID=UPI00345805E9